MLALGPSVRRGDSVQISLFSTFAASLQGRVTALLVDGTYQTITIPSFTTGVGVGAERVESETIFRRDGQVVDGAILNTVAGKRGQTYARLEVRRQTGIHALIAAGYVHGGRIVSLGMNRGPFEGHGHTTNRAIADDIAPADIQHALAGTNRLRKINGFIWYYHCSGDVATRTLRASIRDLGGGLPTGMTSGGNTLAQLWPSAGALSLTANQEGTMVVQGNLFAVSVDNGTAVWENNSTDPSPFPYWAQESDVGEFFFDVSAEEAADRHSIYIINEEWIDL